MIDSPLFNLLENIKTKGDSMKKVTFLLIALIACSCFSISQFPALESAPPTSTPQFSPLSPKRPTTLIENYTPFSLTVRTFDTASTEHPTDSQVIESGLQATIHFTSHYTISFQYNKQTFTTPPLFISQYMISQYMIATIVTRLTRSKTISDQREIPPSQVFFIIKDGVSHAHLREILLSEKSQS